MCACTIVIDCRNYTRTDFWNINWLIIFTVFFLLNNKNIKKKKITAGAHNIARGVRQRKRITYSNKTVFLPSSGRDAENTAYRTNTIVPPGGEGGETCKSAGGISISRVHVY